MRSRVNLHVEPVSGSATGLCGSPCTARLRGARMDRTATSTSSSSRTTHDQTCATGEVLWQLSPFMVPPLVMMRQTLARLQMVLHDDDFATPTSRRSCTRGTLTMYTVDPSGNPATSCEPCPDGVTPLLVGVSTTTATRSLPAHTAAGDDTITQGLQRGLHERPVRDLGDSPEYSWFNGTSVVSVHTHYQELAPNDHRRARIRVRCRGGGRRRLGRGRGGRRQGAARRQTTSATGLHQPGELLVADVTPRAGPASRSASSATTTSCARRRSPKRGAPPTLHDDHDVDQHHEERRAIVSARLTKAEGKIAAARPDLDAGRYDDAASRAYYAMFHGARAMLAAKGLSARSHSGLAAVSGEHLVRSGEVDAQLGRWLGQGRRPRAGAPARRSAPPGPQSCWSRPHLIFVEEPRAHRAVLQPARSAAACSTGRRPPGQVMIAALSLGRAATASCRR